MRFFLIVSCVALLALTGCGRSGGRGDRPPADGGTEPMSALLEVSTSVFGSTTTVEVRTKQPIADAFGYAFQLEVTPATAMVIGLADSIVLEKTSLAAATPDDAVAMARVLEPGRIAFGGARRSPDLGGAMLDGVLARVQVTGAEDVQARLARAQVRRADGSFVTTETVEGQP